MRWTCWRGGIGMGRGRTGAGGWCGERAGALGAVPVGSHGAPAHACFVPFPRAPGPAPTTWSRARALGKSAAPFPRPMQLCRLEPVSCATSRQRLC